jgi:hypothetical protein
MVVLPTPLAPDDDDIGRVLEEIECHERIDGGAVAVLGPGPVEVAERFEAADMSVSEAPFETSARPLVLLPEEQVLDPAGSDGLLPMGKEAVQA